MMTIDEAIYFNQQEAIEWDYMYTTAKEDEEHGVTCRFSEPSEVYAKRRDDARQMAEWLSEYKVLKETYDELDEAYGKLFFEYSRLRKAREDV